MSATPAPRPRGRPKGSKSPAFKTCPACRRRYYPAAYLRCPCGQRLGTNHGVTERWTRKPTTPSGNPAGRWPAISAAAGVAPVPKRIASNVGRPK
jgi:hypothetical protein